MKITIFSQISIDGKLTLGHGGSSKGLFQLLNDEDIQFIHQFRGKVDAIMVGRNTIVTDDPQLTNRYGGNNPLRIIPTSSLDFPDSARVLCSPEESLIVTTERARGHAMIQRIREHGKEVLFAGVDRVDFNFLFSLLQQRGIEHIMVEGGGYLNWQMFDLDVVDDIILMQLPIIIGGATTTTLADGEGYKDINHTKAFSLHHFDARSNYNLLHFKRMSAQTY
ncbi:5-amino-6-(5-phosphoribosylamino)uracil reductase [Kosakonia oryzendophytica]|uniref:5-amino-6-(5-phosphoribosylamino)uracil reductase n=1 Tax=Kosakonia oryzendophytica TaxID=1005665 RepID=A0A1C4E9T7_9ENTR|nr:dihydrofolate reductase family protein [Kosakonia oryzendophytica]AMO46484.1 RibD domain protein [Enterobacter sp. FY-07]TDT51770.1 5-amino-6-(5-phosphoribosylamino)uracil reductase [Enterobacter sp. AG5470]WBT58278.1 dihydrofolate reductase family protein [Kosakonia oryzendophytica]SCC40423.1 5-amino-6-(5-phosphoribosylamino)uracil reductase [Kosakonia oryzendophytica]